MMEEQKICTRCVIDSSVPGVTFDENGVCNYCKLHDKLEQQWPLGDIGQQRLNEMVERIKKDGKGKKYDCIVGVSGGTDSTYTLYLAHKMGLRPLAVTFDSGWSSEIAVSNIKNSTEKLDIDLYTYVVDWEEFKDILRSFLFASLPWADVPTDIGITSILHRVAAQEKVKYILIGQSFRTEGKMPAEWTYSDDRQVNYIVRKFGTKPIKTFPNMTLLEYARYKFLDGIELVLPMNYINYSKSEAREILEKEMGWVYYGGHHYESIYTRFVYSYWLPEKFGIDKRKITHSALVRNGEMTRAEALQIIQQPPLKGQQLEEDIEYVIKKLGFTQEEFDKIMALPAKSFRDYPSHYSMFEFFSPILRQAFKILLPWMPPFFLELEARKEQNARIKAASKAE